MSALNQLLLFALSWMLLFRTVFCDGVLDVRILSFRNPDNRLESGECCQGQPTGDSCRSLCSSFIRLCVTEANLTLESESSVDGQEELCKYGLYVSEPTFGGVRDEHPKNNNLNIAFRFPSPWQGSFGIIMEAWHRTSSLENVTFIGGVPARLISRVQSDKVLLVNEGWKKEKEVSEGSTFEYVMQVQCQTAFYGANCSEMCLERNNNFGHYVCNSEGHKECRPGWTGDACTRPVCREGCHSTNGFCSRPGDCLCRLGWTGALCTECVTLPGCVHGSCSNSSFECSCHEGWDGLFCSDPVCKEGCHPTRGYCSKPDECRCRIGWDGELCNKCKPLPGCARGSCKKPFECTCDEGFQGIFCESPVCSKSCHPINGFCKAPGECRCRVGWSGVNCDECVAYPGCKNGNCTLPWECNCLHGWGGFLCDEPLSFCESNASPCKNGGTCISRTKDQGSFVCACRLGFSGKSCEIRVRE